jgi:hypothetical protein
MSFKQQSVRDEETVSGHGNSLLITAAVLVVELVGTGLLGLGYGVLWALGLPSALVLLLLNLRSINRGVRSLCRAARQASGGAVKLGRLLIDRLASRRTWRISLLTFQLIILLVALPLAWYSYVLHREQRERSSLDGTWRVVGWDGSPVVIPSRGPIHVELAPGTYQIEPWKQPKWIDFPVQGTPLVSKAIYYWDGRRVRVCETSGGSGERPTKFDGSQGTRYVLERIGGP